MINRLFELSREGKSLDEILVLTDANVLLKPNTLFELVRYFKDPSIGLVGSNVINKGMDQKGIGYQENYYISRENKIKYCEGKAYGTMMGAFGACFAIRSELYTKIPESFIVDDFFVSMEVLNKNYLTIQNPSAQSIEELPGSVTQEFHRKMRISAGNFQNLFHFIHLAFSNKKGLAFCFWSHKIIRWVGPFIGIVLAVFGIILFNYHAVYQYITIGLLITFFIPLLDWALSKIGLHISYLKYLSYFIVMNVALFFGFIKYVDLTIKRKKVNVWEPTQRN